MDTQTELLQDAIERFTVLIEQQAQGRIARYCATQIEALSGALAFFGIAKAPVFRYIDVWEDYENGLLPPHIIAEMTITGPHGVITSRFNVPVGAFHDAGKDEQIFECCMLRAEAYQELDGSGDGHVLDRMREIEEMIAAGTVTYDD